MRKATISFVMSVCLHGTTWFPLAGFSLNLLFGYFSKLSRKVKLHQNLTRVTGALHEDQYTFLIVCCSVLRMSNVSDESCREN